MPGIVRINIESNWNDWRTEMARSMEPATNSLYHRLFQDLNMPLMAGEDWIICKKEEAMARYDWKEGIDVLLYFEDGTKATLQEKCLKFPHKSTLTFEERKTSGVPGAWYNCTAQYYFVGYNRQYPRGILEFDDWMLVELSSLHRADKQGKITWYGEINGKDGRRSVLRYAYFAHVPDECIIDKVFKTVCIRPPRYSKKPDVPLADFLAQLDRRKGRRPPENPSPIHLRS